MLAGNRSGALLWARHRMRAFLLPVPVACVALLLGSLHAEDRPPTLADVIFQRANDRLDAGRANEGVAELAHVLRLEPAHAGARQRLASFLTQRTYALPVTEWTFPNAGDAVAFYPQGPLVFSRDGERVVLISGKTAQLFETRTGRKIGRVMPCHAPPVFRADSKVLAVARTERSVELVSAADGKPMRLERKFERDIGRMEFLGNTGALAVNLPLPGDEPKQSAHVFWDTGEGRLLEPPFGRDVRTYLVRTTADARSVVLVGIHHKSNEHWAARMELDGWNKSAGPSLLKKGEKVLDISPDGYQAVIRYGGGPLGGSGKSKTWDIGTGDLIEDKETGGGWNEPTGPWFTADQSRPGSGFDAIWKERIASRTEKDEPHSGIAAELVGRFFGSDGQLALGTYEDGTVTLEGLADKTLPEARHPWRAREARFLRGGQEMAAVESPYDGSRAPRVRIWQWRSGPAVTFWPSRHLRGTDLRFLPQSDKLFVLSESGEMSHWDARTRVRLAGPVKFAEKYQAPYRTDGFKRDVEFSADNGKFLTPIKEDAVRLFDTVTMQPIGEQFSTPKEDGWPHGAILSPDGSLAAMPQKGAAVIFDPKSGKALGRCARTAENDMGLRPMAFDPSGRLLATSDGPVIDWQKNRRLSDPAGQATAYVFIPNTPLLAGVQSAGGLHVHVPASVTFWNLDSPRIKTGENFAERSLCEMSTATAFSADGKLALTCASRDEDQLNAIKLWRFPDMKPACEPVRVPSVITAATFSNDGKFFAALRQNPAIRAGSVRVWETATGTPRTEWMYCGGAVGLEFSHDGRLLLAHGRGGAWLYDLAEDEGIATEELIVLAEAAAGLRVNPATLRAEPHDGLAALAEMRGRKPDLWFFQPLDERTAGPHTPQRLSQVLDEVDRLSPSDIAPLHAYAPAFMAARYRTLEENKSPTLSETALARTRHDPLALLYASRAEFGARQQDFQSAATLARAALSLEKSARILVEVAFYDWVKGDFAAAAEKYREACALDGSHADWWAMRALIHAELGEKAPSAEAFATADKLGRSEDLVRCILGWAKLHLGEYDAAAKWLAPPDSDESSPAAESEFPLKRDEEPQHVEQFWDREKKLAEVVLALIEGTKKQVFFPPAIEDEEPIFKRHRLTGKAKEAVDFLVEEYRRQRKAQKQ